MHQLLAPARHVQFQHKQGDGNGEDAVGERLQPARGQQPALAAGARQRLAISGRLVRPAPQRPTHNVPFHQHPAGTGSLCPTLSGPARVSSPATGDRVFTG
jgi:hypothetical protein